MRSLLVVNALSVPAFAASDRAVLVGSNQAGPGQEPLAWAAADAERMRDVLTEIGGFLPEDVEILQDPDAETLLAAIDRAAADLGDAGGAPTRFVFYYSGHARSRSLSLGADELPIERLDQHLEAVPARQSLAVLDACQAGEPTSPKGIVPEAAFSFVSVAGLSTEGTAVVASSTANELSQESDRLGGSMFTHHWVSALRGAADEDRDGVVTLDEAYDYAYDRTLVATAATAIGPQHPTLRMDLRGHGDWILTRPSAASGQLVLPVPFDGPITVTHRASGNVVAEVAKLPNQEVTLALVPGEYEVLVRIDEDSCAQQVVITAGDAVGIAVSDCVMATVESGAPKSVVAAPRTASSFDHRVALVGRFGAGSFRSDAMLLGGAEAVVYLGPHVGITGGIEVLTTKQVLPPEQQLEYGIYSEWVSARKLHLGVLAKPQRSRVQPYIGADALIAWFDSTAGVQDLGDEGIGGRVRGGVDVMVVENFGLNVDASLGALSGGAWVVAYEPDVALLPQLSTGLFLAL